MTDREYDPNHYAECPVNTGDGPAGASNRCGCAAISGEDDAYYGEPQNMASLEDGSATTPIW